LKATHEYHLNNYELNEILNEFIIIPTSAAKKLREFKNKNVSL